MRLVYIDEKIENTIYNIADLMLILKTYCQKYKSENQKIEEIDSIVNKISNEFDKIAVKF